MTITSVGYAGTVGDAQWANMVPRVGSGFYSVDDYSSFRVSIAAGTRTVQVAAGGAQAYGVYAVSDAAAPITFPAVASGVRWDLISLRRNWATKATTLAVIPGGSSKALPPRTVTPGTLVDQPLYLVRLAAGSNAIQELVDLRCVVQNAGALAWDDLARSYLTQLGTELRIGNVSWSRVTDDAGAATWVSSEQGDTGWVDVPLGPGWGTPQGSYRTQVRAVGAIVSMRGVVSADTSAAVITNFGTLPGPFRPATFTFLGATHGSSFSTFVGSLMVQPSGLISVPPGYYDGSLGIGRYVPMHGTWFRG